MIQQYEFSLSPKRRGFHLVTQEILKQVPELPKTGLFHILIKHTSAALTINENADPTVRIDFNSFTNELVPEGLNYFEHTLEGPDDMPAHIKSSLYGASLTIPVTEHQLNLGIWQGIYLCEFRNHGGSRRFVVTVYS